MRELHSTDETLAWRDPGGSCARKNRTRKKSAVEDDPLNRPEKNKNNEPSGQLKSTESLKRKRH